MLNHMQIFSNSTFFYEFVISFIMNKFFFKWKFFEHVYI